MIRYEYQLCKNDIPENHMPLFSEYGFPKYVEDKKQRNFNVISAVARGKEAGTQFRYWTNTI